MLIDSNIIIYAAQSDHQGIRDFIAKHSPAVSVVSYVEVLGYHGLTDEARRHFEEFFAAARMLPISNEVLEQAVRLRQLRKMSLADALIAGTTIAHNLTLVTRNTEDFNWIEGLPLIDPFAPEIDAG
jgi:predicted nucleic acid-binding protein